MEPSRMLCWAGGWVGKKKIHFRAEWQHGRTDMLRELWDYINSADVLLAHNGVKFDIKVMNKEFLLDGFKPPQRKKVIDTLLVAKKKFRFEHNNLDILGDRLGVGRKVPHAGMSLWLQAMAGDKSAQALMKKYNIQDVQLLKDVYEVFKPWIDNHPNWNIYNDTWVEDYGGAIKCGTCGSSDTVRNGTYHTQVTTMQKYLCNSCGASGKLARGGKLACPI